MLLIFFIFSIILCLSVFLLKKKIITNLLSKIFLAAHSFISINAYLKINQFDSPYYKFDSLAVLLSFVLSILSVATFYHSYLYLKRHKVSKRQEANYYAALMMLITAMTSAYFAENLAVLWASVEATTLLVSILIFYEHTEEALEATWKYLFICSVGIAFAFIGILFLSMTAGNNGLTNLSISGLISIAKLMDPLWLKISFLLALTGFSAKMGLFPLHTVAVDAHTVAPPPISAFISTTLMNVGFLAIYRIFTIVAHTEIIDWVQNVLLIVGLLSVFMATIQLQRVNHFKRMFAFSSLEHMGIVALGLGAGGIGFYAAILHLVFHAFTKASLFYQVGQIHQFFKSYWIKDVSGYFKLNPVGGLSVLFCFISILAIPPSGLFVSEFLIFKALFINNHPFVAIAVLVLLSFIIYTILKNVLHLLYDDVPVGLNFENVKVNQYETISQFVLLSLVIYLGINPPLFFTNLINGAISVLN